MRWVFSAFLVFVILFDGGCIFDTGDVNYSVAGWITTEDGTPLEWIYVSLGENTTMTNSKGYYKFTDVGFGSYYIEAYVYSISYYGNQRYRFEPGRHEITIKESKKINFTAYPVEK